MQNPKISIPKYQISKEESRDRLRSSPLTSHGHGHKTGPWPLAMAISLGPRTPGYQLPATTTSQATSHGHKPGPKEPWPQATATSQATSHGHQPQAHKPWPKILNISGCAWGKPAGRR